MHQVIFHMSRKKQLYHFRKVKLDDKDRNWLILSHSVRERQSSWDRIPHHIHIFRTSCIQLPARSGIFCLLVKVVYWPGNLKFVYPMITLSFLGIIVKLKLPAKFCLHCFEWLCFQISSDTKYFFVSRDGGLIVFIVYYFQIWNKKEHNIIISRVISSHI